MNTPPPKARVTRNQHASRDKEQPGSQKQHSVREEAWDTLCSPWLRRWFLPYHLSQHLVACRNFNKYMVHIETTVGFSSSKGVKPDMTVHTCNFSSCKPQTEGQEFELSEFKPLQDIQTEVVSKTEKSKGGRKEEKRWAKESSSNAIILFLNFFSNAIIF